MRVLPVVTYIVMLNALGVQHYRLHDGKFAGYLASHTL